MQFRKFFGISLADVRDIQGVAILGKRLPVILPGHIVIKQPAVTFEHTLGENDIHILHLVSNAENVRYYFCSCAVKKVFEINLVQHPFNIRQTNLERGVAMLTTEDFVNDGGIFL